MDQCNKCISGSPSASGTLELDGPRKLDSKLDVNNMYVSCERVFRPPLIGRPVVVLSNNDGACIARSNEAMDLGVRMAQPWFQVRHLEREAGLIALSANFELYGDMSSRMMSLVGQYAPRQEVYSIDESFLDFEGVAADLDKIGREMRARVLQWTGLPTSVGFGPTKTLAKLANHVAKMADRKPGSYARQHAQVCNLGAVSRAELQQMFQATDVGHVWGIGRRTTVRLTEGGIRTVLDLVQADIATLRRQFSVVLEKTVLELRGTSCLDVDDEPAAQQQIMCSRSFGSPVRRSRGWWRWSASSPPASPRRHGSSRPPPAPCMSSSAPARSAGTIASTAPAPRCRWRGPRPTPGSSSRRPCKPSKACTDRDSTTPRRA